MPTSNLISGQSEAEYVDFNLHQFSESTKNYNVLDTELNLFLQEIEMAVKMAPGDSWGFVEGIDLNGYVFNHKLTRFQVENEVRIFIENNCEGAKNYPWTVETEFVNVNRRRMLSIRVTVTKKNNEGIDEQFWQAFFLDAARS